MESAYENREQPGAPSRELFGKQQLRHLRYATKFLITKFLITKFLITKFLITKFLITKFLIKKFLTTKFLIIKFLITNFLICKVPKVTVTVITDLDPNKQCPGSVTF